LKKPTIGLSSSSEEFIMAIESNAPGQMTPSGDFVQPVQAGLESPLQPYLGEIVLGSGGEPLHVDFHRWLDFSYDLAEEFADLVAAFEEDSQSNLICYLDARRAPAHAAA
jgi:hypothetical protein